MADGTNLYGTPDAPESDSRIAVVGRAGRFPDAPDVASFWRMLNEGRHAMRRLSEADLLSAGVSRKALADPNYVRTACLLPDMESFDAGFFGFSPREAAILDPQHRHFLEVGWEALEDAGHMPERFDGRIGVYAGSGMQAYLPYNLLTNPDLVEEIGLFLLRHTGNDKDFLATRLSYLLNLTGPSIAIQTACSTSLVAVHTAMGALMNMECDLALAGGVTIELPHGHGYRFAEGEILSPDGLCRAFDDDAKGTVFGSGAALVALRRYTDAVEDGDDIKAVLLASAVNNDGAGKASYLAPSVDGQAEAAAEALALSGLEARDIGYIEAHGTGTPIGDPIELEALGEVYSAAGQGRIGIGSVKTNIGHLDTAAGAAGLIKVIEALRHQQLPATLNFSKPNTRYNFGSGPFRVQSDAEAWTGTDLRRAAVNSLGVGGTNAHVIVEEAPPRAAAPEDGAWQVCLYSGRDMAALDRTGPRWAGFLADTPPSMADVATTLRKGRRAFDARMAVAARTPEELSDALTAKASPLRCKGTATEGAPSVVFLFPGGGAQYPGAGAGMMAQSPVFAEAVESCFARLPKSAPADLRTMMFERDTSDDEAREKIGRSSYAIPALFILEYAYAKLWESWGVTPDAILAHSAGEYAGAVISGAMKLSDALKIVVLRGQVMDAAPEGAMTAVPMGEEAVKARLGTTLDIAAVNSADATVVSGETAEIEAFERQLEGEGVNPQRIRIDVAAHSRHLQCQLDRFREGFENVEFGKLKTPMVSSLRGDWAAGDDLTSADYWVRHLRHTVRFKDAVWAAFDRPDRVVIEMGPGQTLGPLIETADTPKEPRSVLASAPRPREDADEMGVALTALGGLWAAGAEVDWTRLGAPEGRRISVPTYAFAKDRHWIEPGRGAAQPETDGAPVLSRRAEIADWFDDAEWVESIQSPATPDGHWLVFAGNDPFSTELLERLENSPARVTLVRPGESFKAEGDGIELNPTDAEDYIALADHLDGIPDRVISLWAHDRAKDDPFAPAYLLAQMLQSICDGSPVALSFVVPTEDQENGVPLVAPRVASLLGLVRSAPREVSGLTAALLYAEAGTEDAVIAELAGRLSDDVVSLSDGRRFVREMRSLARPAPAGLPSRLSQGGAYLVTGGTGGIGRELALWLATSVGAKVGLLSRNAVPDQALEKKIRAAGGDVMVIAADVTDESQMRKARHRMEKRFGAVTGVIHAAGTIDDAPLTGKDLARAEAVMAPKIKGGEVLDAVFPVGDIDLFAVISSTSVAIGPAGQSDYVGANAALEALAAARSDGLAIAWGIWRDIGMAARVYGAGTTGHTCNPLLGQRFELENGEVRFDRVLDPEADWELAEHRVGGAPVLPGTAYIERAISAVRAEVGRKVSVDIRSLSFSLPMRFPEALPRRLSVVLRPCDDGYEVRIESVSAEGQAAMEHATAIVSVSRAKRPEPRPAPRALLAGDENGQAAQAGEVEFGPRWFTRGLIETSGDCVTASVRLAPEFHGDLSVHPTHPALLDVAATVGLHLLSPESREGLVYAPMSIDRATQFGDLPELVVARAERIAGEDRSFVTFDVSLYSEDGTCLMVIERFAMRAVEGGALDSGEVGNLTERLLATGIRRSEAGQVFSRAFDHDGKSLIVSPVDTSLVRLAIAEAHAAPKGASAKSGGGGEIGSATGARLAALWSETLGVENVGEADDFFALGGHSLSAVRMFGRVRKEFGITLPLATLFEAPTLGELADLISTETGADKGSHDSGAQAVSARTSDERSLVRISKGSADVRPFFIVHGAGGNVLNFRPLAGFLDERIPFYGLRAKGADGNPEVDATVEDMAARYLKEVRELQPKGPYRFGGYSGGGLVAYEMAQQLRALGEETEHVVFFDTLAAHVPTQGVSLWRKIWAARKWEIGFAIAWLDRRREKNERESAEVEIKRLLNEGAWIPDELIGHRMHQSFVASQSLYQAKPYDGQVTIFRASRASSTFLVAGRMIGWQGLIRKDTPVFNLSCDHVTMMSEPAVAEIGTRLNELLLADR